ncbi:MAG: pyruvate kinase [Vicinamibacteria bacterium]
MRRTKIVATIGPASSNEVVLEQLIAAGATVFRLNFSHGSHDDHARTFTTIRSVAKRRGDAVAILQDLSGPKIRTTKVANAEGIILETGRTLVITNDEAVIGTPERIGTTYEPLPRDVKVGDTILLDDGNLELRVLGTTANGVNCEIIHGGVLKSNKGMNLPNVSLSIPALTEKDRADLAFGIALGVDYVALSFVRRAEDLREAKDLITSLGGDAPLIAKIEKREAIANLAAILEEADGVMVARGDLGVEMSTEEVPTLQKRIIAMANAAGKPVITATQMLESMIDRPRPTRAEASDVANAILDGTDAVMLSAETASGHFPVESVETMARIADYTEENDEFQSPVRLAGTSVSAVARALARAASMVALELQAQWIMAFTETGSTARHVSGFRPRARIAGVTPSEKVHRRLALQWGVVPILLPREEGPEELLLAGERALKGSGLVKTGDRLIILAGQSHTAGATNMMKVHTVR